MRKESLLACLEFKIGQEAETDLQSGQLILANSSNLSEPGVRVAEIFQGLHRDSETSQKQSMAVSASDGYGTLFHGQPVYVETGGQVDCG